MRNWIEDLPGLGLGSLSSPPITTAIARAHFVDRLNSLAHNDLNDLWRVTMPSYRELVEIGKAEVPNRGSDFPYVVLRSAWVKEAGVERQTDKLLDIIHWGDLALAAVAFPTAAKLRNELRMWAVARHLDVPWFLEVLWRWTAVNGGRADATAPVPISDSGSFALRSSGRSFSSRSSNLSTMGATPDRLPAEYQTALPTLRPYNPLGETRDEYLKPLSKQLEAYCKAVENQYLKLGFTKLQRGTMWHLDWFVQYQVLNLTCAEIADRMSGIKSDESTVYKAVKAVAKLLDVPLRRRSQRRPA